MQRRTRPHKRWGELRGEGGGAVERGAKAVRMWRERTVDSSRQGGARRAGCRKGVYNGRGQGRETVKETVNARAASDPGERGMNARTNGEERQ